MAFLNEYEKIHMIGKGSFATIWKVRHIELGYVRAIKVSNELVEDENDPAYKSFLRECKVLLNIGNGSHPNIVHIYQPRLIDNRAIVEMDYVDGETLSDYLKRVGFMPIDEMYRFVSEIVGALAYCHHDIFRYMMNPNEDDLQTDPNDGRRFIIDEETERRLVKKYAVTHNDIHSNNVMRRNYDGNFILLDFGLAIQDGKAVKSSSRRCGALEYMSPEKFEDDSVISTQSDIYSLGILLYEALAGRVPFVIDSDHFSSNQTLAQYQIMKAHQQAVPPSIEELRSKAFENTYPGQTYIKDYPDWLENMILKCLAKNPDDRYADAKDLLDDFNTHRKKENNNVSSTANHANDDSADLTACHYCGEMISSDALFCQHCGHPTRNQPHPPIMDEVIDEEDTNYFSESDTRQQNPSMDVNHMTYIDLGLPSGILWAEKNIGAKSPEDCGNYYAWGETSTKSVYKWDTYRYYNADQDKLTKYCSSPQYGVGGYTDRRIALQSRNDVATKMCGDDARMPTKTDWEELKNNTTQKWTVVNGVKGMLLVSKRNGKSIFLPASGFFWEDSCRDAENIGYYWSSSLYTEKPSNAWGISFDVNKMSIGYSSRSCGRCIRPVRSIASKPIPDTKTSPQAPVIYIDLGLPSGTKWKISNEKGFYNYNEAINNFGHSLPTKAQMEELLVKCRWTWIGGGCRVTGPNGNFIEFPAVGVRYLDGSVRAVDNGGLYWTSTPFDTGKAWNLFFDSKEANKSNFDFGYGLSVRLVQN